MSSEKKENSVWQMIKLGLILAAFAVISCTVLALVNNGTSGRIESNRIRKANAAMKEVMPEATAFTEVTDFSQISDRIKIETMSLASKDSDLLGGVVQVSGPTYDKARIMVGMTKDGTVTGIKFLELTDSPGFGLKANDPRFFLPNGKTFCGQFEGVSISEGFNPGESIDAISGATITSKGVADLVREGTQSLAMAMKKQSEGADNE